MKFDYKYALMNSGGLIMLKTKIKTLNDSNANSPLFSPSVSNKVRWICFGLLALWILRVISYGIFNSWVLAVLYCIFYYCFSGRRWAYSNFYLSKNVTLYLFIGIGLCIISVFLSRYYTRPMSDILMLLYVIKLTDTLGIWFSALFLSRGLSSIIGYRFSYVLALLTLLVFCVLLGWLSPDKGLIISSLFAFFVQAVTPEFYNLMRYNFDSKKSDTNYSSMFTELSGKEKFVFYLTKFIGIIVILLLIISRYLIKNPKLIDLFAHIRLL